MKDHKAVERLVAAQIDEHVKLVSGQGRSWARTIAAVADTLITSLRAGGKVLLAGNGGSAADAQHVTAEFVGRFLRERRSLAAVSLTANSSVVTAVANDYSFSKVFRRQVEALGKPGDVLWVFSTSGASRNVIEACHAAHQRGMTVIGFTGAGGRLAKAADIVLAVPGRNSARIQEGHALAYHIVCDLVEAAFVGKAAGPV